MARLHARPGLERTLPGLDPEALTARLHTFVDDLRAVLAGDDREAMRARDLIRAMVDKITVTPTRQEKEDGRGAGPVRLAVEGGLARMFDLAEVRVGPAILHGSCPRSGLSGSTLAFRYQVDVAYRDPRLVGQGYEDLALFCRPLAESDAPVTRKLILGALAGGAVPADREAAAALDKRMRSVVERAKQQGLARSIRLGPKSGWVSNRLGLTDADWRQRAFPDQPLQHPRQPAPGKRRRQAGPGGRRRGPALPLSSRKRSSGAYPA